MATLPTQIVSASAQAVVDCVLIGVKWASAKITYSFRDSAPLDSVYSADFSALSTMQSEAAQQALARWAAVCNLEFSEVADNSGNGIIRFGTCSSTVVPTSAA